MPQAGTVFDIRNRPTIKGPDNPMDRSTIISIYDRQIFDSKWTLSPGQFTIESGRLEKPSLTLIGPSSWWKDVDIDQPLIEIIVGSVQMAESIIRDYCSGMYGVDMGNQMPGLFFVPGVVNTAQLKTDKKLINLLEDADRKQKNWFNFLINQADSLWAKTNGNPLAIMEDMRIAARELHLDKDWAKSHTIRELVQCIFCGSLRNPKFPKCGHCLEIVDKQLAKTLGLIQ